VASSKPLKTEAKDGKPSFLASRGAIALAGAALVLAALAVYSNSFFGPFIFDDRQWIVENAAIRHLWTALLPGHASVVSGRPVLSFSFAVNHAISGTSVWSYHVLNLVIHALAGLLLFGVVRRTLLQPVLRERFGGAALALALAVAVIWTIHPLQTGSVTYISQRAESLMGLFYLLTIYCFVRGAGSSAPGRWYILSVVACALGMATKEVMVSAPLLVLLYDRTFVAGSFREAWRQRWRLYLGLAGTWLVLGYLMIGLGNRGVGYGHAFTWWTYALTECRAVVKYLCLAVWPHPLVLDYGMEGIGHPLEALPFALILVVLVAATAIGLWRRPGLGFAGACFFVILAPTSSVVPIAFQPMAENRMYLALAAVVTLAVLAIYTLAGRRSLAVCLLLAVGLGFSTHRRNDDYQSAVTIWNDTVAKRPNNPRGHNNLGYALDQAGGMAAAKAQYEEALRLDPSYADAHNNLGGILDKMGQQAEAKTQYEETLRLDPGQVDARNNLGMVLEKMGRVAAAKEQYEEALRLKPDSVEAHNNLGNALDKMGRLAEARAQYEEALRLEPENARAHDNLGNLFEKMGQVAEAKAQYEAALKFEPENANAHYNLATALARMGRLPEAIEQYGQALRFKPDYFEAHNNLGTALLQAGRVPEAIEHYEQALRLKPDYAKAHYNLGNALVRAGRIPEAIRHYQQALLINPAFAEARDNLARLQAYQKTGGYGQ
jgi:tetratricopeptide (TPR) repeat protein